MYAILIIIKGRPNYLNLCEITSLVVVSLIPTRVNEMENSDVFTNFIDFFLS